MEHGQEPPSKRRRFEEQIGDMIEDERENIMQICDIPQNQRTGDQQSYLESVARANGFISVQELCQFIDLGEPTEFLSLPPEIIDHILQLAREGQPELLRSFAGVSKQAKEYARPLFSRAIPQAYTGEIPPLSSQCGIAYSTIPKTNLRFLQRDWQQIHGVLSWQIAQRNLERLDAPIRLNAAIINCPFVQIQYPMFNNALVEHVTYSFEKRKFTVDTLLTTIFAYYDQPVSKEMLYSYAQVISNNNKELQSLQEEIRDSEGYMMMPSIGFMRPEFTKKGSLVLLARRGETAFLGRKWMIHTLTMNFDEKGLPIVQITPSLG